MKLFFAAAVGLLLGSALRAEVIDGFKGRVLANFANVSVGCSSYADEMAPGLSWIFQVNERDYMLVRWDESFLSEKSREIYRQELEKAPYISDKFEVMETFCRMSLDELAGRLKTTQEALHFKKLYLFSPVYAIDFVSSGDIDSYRPIDQIREALRQAGLYVKDHLP